jgi:hypothetical protein
MQEPLIIPTNVLNFGKFSGTPKGNADGSSFQATLSQCMENCDSIFILQPFNNNQTTCFYNPFVKNARLTLGEFGIHPSRPIQTWEDPRFLSMCLDSLNLERSDISALSKDVARSLGFNRPYYTVMSDLTPPITEKENIEYGDKSSFFVGISLSQMGFQSGCVSSPNTNIPFLWDCNIDRTPTTYRKDTPEITTGPIAMCLLDEAFIIQVSPNSNIPIVKLTTKSVV